MPSTEILEYEMILEEIQAASLEAERRFHVPGCGYDCDDGWHEIAFSEFDPLDLIPDPTTIVLPWGLILFACECNSGAGGRVRRWPEWMMSQDL